MLCRVHPLSSLFFYAILKAFRCGMISGTSASEKRTKNKATKAQNLPSGLMHVLRLCGFVFRRGYNQKSLFLPQLRQFHFCDFCLSAGNQDTDVASAGKIETNVIVGIRLDGSFLYRKELAASA